MSHEEKIERQEKGLCFKCNSRNIPNHQCQLQALQVYVVQEDGSEVRVEDKEEETKIEELQEGPVFELFLNSGVGISSPRTMKILGKTMEQDVVVLNDPGVSHNFISINLVQNLEIVSDFLPLDLRSADVILGRQWLETVGETTFKWKLQEMRFKTNGGEASVKGDPSLCNSPVALQILWKTVRDRGEGVVMELGRLETSTP